ncbi:cytochrome P450 [Daldinia sp. FL1419]|nr:cytochrome P450 [Daldinia sp. FL1419]
MSLSGALPVYALSIVQYITLWLAVGLVLYLIQNEVIRYRSRIKNLPGPHGWPVVGNLFQHRDVVPAETYRRWSLKYGPVFQIQLGNTTAVVINSAQAAKQLFLGQSHAMNSRPIFYVFHSKVSKAVTSIGTSPWDESCKRRRKLAASALNKTRVATYGPILSLEAREFLKDLYSACKDGTVEIDFRPAVKRFSPNLSLTLNYGTRVSSVKSLTDDPLLSEIIYVESEISKFRDTGKNYANYIPLLRYWEPVAQLIGLDSQPRNHAADIGRRRLEYNDILLKKLRDEVRRGEDKPCIQGAVLRDPESVGMYVAGI